MTTAAVLAPLTRQQFFSNNGIPLAGGFLYTYQAGSSTPAPTYTDSTGLVQNPNPLILDTRGSCSIWVTPNVSLKINVTDNLGNTIPGYPVDQVSVAQLITLYGGVDTGTANFYILTFVASFSAYANGTVLYWVPAHSNSGASTLNVNGLGVVPIINLNGTALGASQITANQIAQVIYYAGNWYLNTIGAYVGPTIGTFGLETSLTAATTTDLGSVNAHVVAVTGSTTITSFGSSANVVAPVYLVRFTGSPLLTYGASLKLPGATNITATPGDALLAEYQGAGVWQVLLYQGAGVVSGLFTGTLTGMSATLTGQVNYLITGSSVAGFVATLWLQGNVLTGTSNATSMTMTGLPAGVIPSSDVTVTTLVENTSTAQTFGLATIGANGVITFQVFEVSGTALVPIGFVNSGTKGLGADWTITYPLTATGSI